MNQKITLPKGLISVSLTDKLLLQCISSNMFSVDLNDENTIEVVNLYAVPNSITITQLRNLPGDVMPPGCIFVSRINLKQGYKNGSSYVINQMGNIDITFSVDEFDNKNVISCPALTINIETLNNLNINLNQIKTIL